MTGSAGFVGKNLTLALSQRSDLALTSYEVGDDPASLATLATLAGGADFIFHLAGVNCPRNPASFTAPI